MIDEAKLLAAQKAFMAAPATMNGATFCAFLAAVALDRADEDEAIAKLILEGAIVLVDHLARAGQA